MQFNIFAEDTAKRHLVEILHRFSSVSEFKNSCFN